MTISSKKYDSAFKGSPDLTWYPWIGECYDPRPVDDRILIVGESHYIKAKTEEEAIRSKERHLGDPTVTREKVKQGMLEQIWDNPTYSKLHSVLSPSKTLNRQSFWGDTCFYNFVQQPLWLETKERPTKQDFLSGWAAFLDVVEILKPGHCLFIGVSASNFFNIAMTARSAKFDKAAQIEKIGNTWSRQASVMVNGRMTPIHSIQHTSGRGFDPDLWRSYLQRQAPDLMRVVANPAYHTLSGN
jgi:hypothetical protein